MLIKLIVAITAFFAFKDENFEPLTGTCRHGDFSYSSSVLQKSPGMYEVTNKITNDHPERGDLVAYWEAGDITQYSFRNPIKTEGWATYYLKNPYPRPNTPIKYGNNGNYECKASCYLENPYTKYTASGKWESKAAVVDENGNVLDRIIVFANIFEDVGTTSLKLSLSPGTQALFYASDSLKLEQVNPNSISIERFTVIPDNMDKKFKPVITNWLTIDDKSSQNGGKYIHIRNYASGEREIQFTMRGNNFEIKKLRMVLLQGNSKGLLGFSPRIYLPAI